MFCSSHVAAPGALHLDEERHAPVDQAEQPIQRQDEVAAVAQGDLARRGVARGNRAGLAVSRSSVRS